MAFSRRLRARKHRTYREGTAIQYKFIGSTRELSHGLLIIFAGRRKKITGVLSCLFHSDRCLSEQQQPVPPVHACVSNPQEGVWPRPRPRGRGILPQSAPQQASASVNGPENPLLPKVVPSNDFLFSPSTDPPNRRADTCFEGPET